MRARLSRRELWRKCYSLAGCTPKQQDAETVGEVFIERQDFGLKAVLCLQTLPPSPPVGNLSIFDEDWCCFSVRWGWDASIFFVKWKPKELSLKYLLQTFCQTFDNWFWSFFPKKENLCWFLNGCHVGDQWAVHLGINPEGQLIYSTIPILHFWREKKMRWEENVMMNRQKDPWEQEARPRTSSQLFSHWCLLRPWQLRNKCQCLLLGTQRHLWTFFLKEDKWR